MSGPKDSLQQWWDAAPSIAARMSEAEATARAEIEALRKDAERYRWLRANAGEIVTSAWDVMMFHGGIGNAEDGAALDAAIDAAIASSKA